MEQRKQRVVILLGMILFWLWISVTTGSSSSKNILTEFPLTPINPTIYPQFVDNWCGPSAASAAIQAVLQYNDGANPTPTIVPNIPRATLWAFMRDNECNDIGGRDHALPGVVGDATNQVRKLNIAYDIGADPHAMAWTMWNHTGGGFYYHYWVYESADSGTRSLLYTLEKYHEPVMVAALHGSHWVDIVGYKAENSAYPYPPLGITKIKISDPLDGSTQWYDYSGSSTAWIDYWFTNYIDAGDPDPSTGWYVPPPDHWRNKWVTIERDAYPGNPDNGCSLQGIIPYNVRIYLPSIKNDLQ